MYLQRVDVVGFRGISRLSLSLDQNTVLIGENAWGKSSLLDLLTFLLAPDDKLYAFTENDFYFPPGERQAKERHLQVVFTFSEKEANTHQHSRYRHINPAWVMDENGEWHIYLHIEGELCDDGSVATWRRFLDYSGQTIELHDIEQMVKALISVHPVLRLRDSRFVRQTPPTEQSENQENQILTDYLQQLSEELEKNPHSLTNKELKGGLLAMQQLLDHYFSARTRQRSKRKHPDPATNHSAWQSLEMLNKVVATSRSRSLRLILLGIFSALLQTKGAITLDPQAQPLLLMEDPETRLHPIMLSVAWGLLSQLPLQRITTTNSSQLLSLVPAESICRLVRQSSGIASYRIGPAGMSAEDSRRIAFHIRFNRASALFARCWLLVEGETEVWLLNQLARLCGHQFESEGVKIIEFAQSGLKPLLKFANRMGIACHVLVDGDAAGKKYASTVRSLLDKNQEIERDNLTILPALNMEFFMYKEGFKPVYHRVANVPDNAQVPVRRVVEKAIHHSSKPDLAIEVAMEAVNQGEASVPLLLKKMFSRVLWLARSKAD